MSIICIITTVVQLIENPLEKWEKVVGRSFGSVQPVLLFYKWSNSKFATYCLALPRN